MSDVFAARVKQRLRGQTAAEADWLIGEGLFLPGVAARGWVVHGRPRHRVRGPGDRQGPAGRPHGVVRRHHRGQWRGAPQLGHPQPRLPPLVATRLGGHSWSGPAGSGSTRSHSSAVGPDTGFAEFARATAAAGDDRGLRDVVGRAWVEVAGAGLRPPGERPAPRVPGPRWRRCCGRGEAGEELVEVTRSGGFAGRTVHAAVSTTGEDPRAAEVRAGLPDRPRRGAPEPAAAGPVRLLVRRRARRGPHEQTFTPDLSRLAALVLDDL